MSNFIGNCERCQKIGFEMCKCPKPYTLKIGDDAYPQSYIDGAILAGVAVGKPFTVDSVEPRTIVYYWQPGMRLTVYDRSWQEYEMNCQKRLQGVMGND